MGGEGKEHCGVWTMDSINNCYQHSIISFFVAFESFFIFLVYLLFNLFPLSSFPVL